MVLKVYPEILLIVQFYAITDETFGEALRSLETCVLVNSNLCKKLFPSLESPITFDENFKVTSVSLFFPYFK